MTPKRKMQNVNFSNVEELLAFLPDDECRVVERLRKIIFNCMPDCTEKLAYNVPFYKKHANICFIWPSAVTWGGTGHQGVRFGFTNGYLLTDEIGYLDKGTRKQVYWRDFYTLDEIDAGLLKAFIFEAALVDEEKMRAKKKNKKIVPFFTHAFPLGADMQLRICIVAYLARLQQYPPGRCLKKEAGTT